MDFKVKEIHNTEEYCNLNPESVIGLYPGEGKTPLGQVNSRQVVKKGS